MRKSIVLIAAMTLLLSPAFAAGKEKDKAGKKPKSETAETAKKGKAEPGAGEVIHSITHHTLSTLSGSISYAAEAVETEMKGEDGAPEASIFSVSYLRENVKDAARPVIFIFNGGPGSASLWLHLGLYGPKRVLVPDAMDAGAPPYPLADNKLSLIDIADLVFIDPVGTGYSRALGKKEAKDFWGVVEDAKSISAFIRLWLNKHHRWNSPLYLSGESYGTTRSAAVAYELGRGYNKVTLNGIILISSILDFTGARFGPGNEIAYLSNLPTYAATAWYHGKTGKSKTSLKEHVEVARAFASGDYALALLKGNRMSAEERAGIRDKLAALTGLSPAFIENADLRIEPSQFQKELLRGQGLTVGRLDGRYKGKDYDNSGERPDDDPSGYGVSGAFTAAINEYLQGNLKVQTDRPYEVLSGKVGRGWHWSMQESEGAWPAYINVAPWLGETMRQNSGLKVLVANGYYDMATPFFATENTFAANGIPADRVKMTYYEAGHMMYLHPSSFETLSADIRGFIGKR